MRRMVGRRAVVVLLAVALSGGLVACFGPEKDTHPNQVLTKRRALFKQYTRILEPIGLVASGRKEYQREEFLSSVQDLEKLSDKPWLFFPADGNYSPTRSKPEVWTQPEKFKLAQDSYRSAVHELLLVAQRGDRDAIGKAVNTVTESCKACHRDFRNE